MHNKIALSIVLASFIISPVASLSSTSPIESPVCYEDGDVTICQIAPTVHVEMRMNPVSPKHDKPSAEQVALARYAACFIAARYWHLDMSLCD